MEASSIKLEQDTRLYDELNTSLIRLAELQILIYTDEDSSEAVCPAALADFDSFEKEGILGYEAALNTMKFTIESFYTLTENAAAPDLSLEARACFLRVWSSLLSAKRPAKHSSDPFKHFASILGRLGGLLFSFYIEFFCMVTDAVVYTGSGTAKGSASDPAGSTWSQWPDDSFASKRDDLIRSLVSTTSFWTTLSLVNFQGLKRQAAAREVVLELIRQHVQKEVFVATTSLQTHLAAAPSSKLDTRAQDGSAMDLKLVSIAAQAACYSVFIQSAEESGTPVPLMETVRWVSPASQCMRDIVQSYEEALKAGSCFDAKETWENINIASAILLKKPFSMLSWAADQAAGGSDQASSSTTNEISNVLSCMVHLFQLDASLAGLAAAQPQVFQNSSLRGGGSGSRDFKIGLRLLPCLSYQLAFKMISFVATMATMPRDIKLAKPAAREAMEVAIKCKIALSKLLATLPVAFVDAISSKYTSTIPSIRGDEWLRRVDNEICLLFTVLAKVTNMTPGSSDFELEEDLLTSAGALLGILHAHHCFDRHLAPNLSTQLGRYGASILLCELREMFARENWLLLPIDIPALESLRSIIKFGEAEVPDRSGIGPEVTTDRLLPIWYSDSGTTLLVRSSQGAVQCLENLIKAARDEDLIQQRRVMRSKALATRFCCNLECITLPRRGKKVSSHRCSGCLAVHYCSPKCQKKDWKEHKLVCKELKRIREL